MPSFLLVHAPLLGPGSWRPCAGALTAAGHEVLVPDLRAHVTPADGWWRRVADGCADAAGSRDVIVVGHSGAGVVLPLVAARCSAAAVVFVDAITPAASGWTSSSERIREFAASLPHEDGFLPRWSTWWGEQAMAELVPDPDVRAALEADQPRLPADFFEHAVPVPAAWQPSTVAYLQLSEPYDADATEAGRRGWTVRRLPGTHLDPLTRPARIVDALLTSVDA